MKILATFVNFTYDPDIIEMIHAWDEYTVDANPSGYDETRQKTIESYGNDLLNIVDTEIEVDMAEIYERFKTVQVAGTAKVVTSAS